MATLKPIDRSSKVIVSEAGPVYVPTTPGPFAEDMTSPLVNQALELATKAEQQTNAMIREGLIAEALICWGLSRLGQR
jgi:hypothetical protein